MTSIAATRSKTTLYALVTGILLIGASLRAPVTAAAPAIGSIRDDLGLSTAYAGAMTTLPLLAFALMSPFSPRLARRYGLERSLSGALMAIAAGTLLRSAGGTAALLAGTVLVGLGIAVGNVLLPSIVKRDFPDSVAAMTGAYALSMGVAAGVGSAVVVPLEHAFGWRVALVTFVVIPLAGLAVWSSPLVGRMTTDRNAVEPPATAPVWRSALAWQITLFLGLNSLIYYVIISWLPTMLIDAGMSAAMAGSLHGAIQLATAVPGLFMGPILQRLRDQRLPAITVASCSALALAGFYVAPEWSLAWSILFGLGTGSGIILGLALVGLRSAHAAQAASLSGMAQSVGYLLAAIGPMGMGALHDHAGNWSLVLMLCTAFALMAAAMGALAGRNR